MTTRCSEASKSRTATHGQVVEYERRGLPEKKSGLSEKAKMQVGLDSEERVIHSQ